MHHLSKEPSLLFFLFALCFTAGALLQMLALAVPSFRTGHTGSTLFLGGTLLIMGGAVVDRDATLFAGEALLLIFALYRARRLPVSKPLWLQSLLRSPMTQGVCFFCLLALVVIGLRYVGPDMETVTALTNKLVLQHGWWGMAGYILLVGALSCLAVPRQILGFVGGMALGALWGTLLTTLGTTLGCFLALSCSRTVGRAAMERRYASKLDKLNRFLERAPFCMAVLLRLFPSGNNLLFSLMAGVSRIPVIPFVLGSCVGYVPQNLVFALLGSGVNIAPQWQVGLSVALFVLVTVLGWGVYKRVIQNAL